ncbi:hypothetical protein LTR39_003941 [Cryomyces antarcticus]|nr:hypothetical protein LTR39_003941 [Cryomyces antarcticus]
MATNGHNAGAPSGAADAVLKRSDPVSEEAREVQGIEFNEYADRSITVEELVAGMTTMGFQATSVGEAVEIIEGMRAWRDPETGEKTTIFLGYTSNLISSGLRETLRFLVQHKHVSAVVTTAGGVEEDFIKCLAPTYLGSFSTSGASLRAKALTDGSLGDMLYFHTFKSSPEQLRVDIVEDIRKINTIAVRAKRAKADGDSVKVYAEATVVFPLIVAATFAKVNKASSWKTLALPG